MRAEISTVQGSEDKLLKEKNSQPYITKKTCAFFGNKSKNANIF